jgi:nitrate reductase NapD
MNRPSRRSVLLARSASPAPGGAFEIASVLVHTRPERLDAARCVLEAMAGTEVRDIDPRGKLVVVIEAEGSGAIGVTLNRIAVLPDVISATLVYHAVES